MKKETILIRRYKLGIILSVIALFSSCESLLDVESPKSKLSSNLVFEDDASATAAITGMYVTMVDPTNFASGSAQGLAAQAGLSADEFANFKPENLSAIEFYENRLNANNSYVLNLWTTAYKIIYQANSAIESLEKSTSLSPAVKNQLLGESLFIRAFCHFNLVNMFGDVPLITSTDYKTNTNAVRRSIDDVYEKILDDLLEAQAIIGETYPSMERVRPNRDVVTALLARVYLYREDWLNAEIQSTSVIGNSIYALESDLNNVFLAVSTEAIWQLRQTSKTINTWEGNHFILFSTPGYSSLTLDLVNSFETDDARRVNWVRSITTGDGLTFYYPFKYKIRRGGPGSATPIPLSEYSMIFRLAEQYLIRAEARSHLDKLDDAIQDLDMIRERAGLPLIQDTNPSISSENLRSMIQRERRSEMFIEWGHRWFDLKRTGKATEVLSPKKTDWQDTDVLYPIPSIEFTRNPNLGEQNFGY